MPETEIARTWEASIGVASAADRRGWIHAEGSPFISEFHGTRSDLIAHLPRIGSHFAGGSVMQWGFIPKD